MLRNLSELENELYGESTIRVLKKGLSFNAIILGIYKNYVNFYILILQLF